MFDRDTKELLIGLCAILLFGLALTFVLPSAMTWYQH
jgi:hypothetical protein